MWTHLVLRNTRRRVSVRVSGERSPAPERRRRKGRRTVHVVCAEALSEGGHWGELEGAEGMMAETLTQSVSAFFEHTELLSRLRLCVHAGGVPCKCFLRVSLCTSERRPCAG